MLGASFKGSIHSKVSLGQCERKISQKIIVKKIIYLIQSTLWSLSIYFMSLFNMLRKVRLRVEKI